MVNPLENGLECEITSTSVCPVGILGAVQLKNVEENGCDYEVFIPALYFQAPEQKGLFDIPEFRLKKRPPDSLEKTDEESVGASNDRRISLSTS